MDKLPDLEAMMKKESVHDFVKREKERQLKSVQAIRKIVDMLEEDLKK